MNAGNVLVGSLSSKIVPAGLFTLLVKADEASSYPAKVTIESHFCESFLPQEKLQKCGEYISPVRHMSSDG